MTIMTTSDDHDDHDYYDDHDHDDHHDHDVHGVRDDYLNHFDLGNHNDHSDRDDPEDQDDHLDYDALYPIDLSELEVGGYLTRCARIAVLIILFDNHYSLTHSVR